MCSPSDQLVGAARNTSIEKHRPCWEKRIWCVCACDAGAERVRSQKPMCVGGASETPAMGINNFQMLRTCKGLVDLTWTNIADKRAALSHRGEGNYTLYCTGARAVRGAHLCWVGRGGCYAVLFRPIPRWATLRSVKDVVTFPRVICTSSLCGLCRLLLAAGFCAAHDGTRGPFAASRVSLRTTRQGHQIGRTEELSNVDIHCASGRSTSSFMRRSTSLSK